MNWLDTRCIGFEGSRRIAQGALREVALASKAVIDLSLLSTARGPLPVLIFDERSSETIELDWRGSQTEFLARLEQRAAQLGDQYLSSSNLPNLVRATGRPIVRPQSQQEDQSQEQPHDQPQDQPQDQPLAIAEIAQMRRGPGRPKLGVVPREVTLLPRHWDWLATQPGGASVVLRKLVEVARLASEEKDRVRRAREVGYKFMSTMAGHEVGFEEASRALFAGNRVAFETWIATWPEDVQAHLNALLTDAFSVSP